MSLNCYCICISYLSWMCFGFVDVVGLTGISAPTVKSITHCNDLDVRGLLFWGLAIHGYLINKTIMKIVCFNLTIVKTE